MIGRVVCEGVVDFDQHWWRMDIERFGGRCRCRMCRMRGGSLVCSILVEYGQHQPLPIKVGSNS